VYATQVSKIGSEEHNRRLTFGHIALFAFVLTQALDGLLTYIGVNTFGLRAEGNPVIAWLMDSFGNGAGLAAAKCAAICFGVALYLSNVPKAVAGLACFYLLVAICPWLALLYFGT
jgi:hypothetical protein